MSGATVESRRAARVQAEARRQLRRRELADRNAVHASEIFLQVGEREAAALAAGFVPRTVRRLAQCALDWQFRPRRGKAS